MFMNDRGFVSEYSVLDALVSVGKVRLNGSVYQFGTRDGVAEVKKSEIDEYFSENPKHAELLHNAYRGYMSNA